MRTVEIGWEDITSNESVFGYGTILHNYDRYVAEIDDEFELANIVGTRYFTEEYAMDEIMQMFAEMITSPRCNSLTHNLAFAYFFIKKALYTKMITREEFVDIFRTYFGTCTIATGYQRGGTYDYTPLKHTDFINKLTRCNRNSLNTVEEDDMVYDTFLKLIIACKY